MTTIPFLERMRAAWQAGFQYSGNRDLYTVFGYKTVLRHRDFVAKYERQEIATRIIDAPVDAVWTDKPTLRLGQNGQPWDEWNKLVDTYPIYQNLRKADIFAGLGMFSLLLVGIDDGMKLDRPVNKNRQNKITYLQPYLEGSVTIKEYEDDSSNPRFGKPKLYEVDPGVENTLQPSEGLKSKSLLRRQKFTVHYSRVLHVADGTLEDGIFGRSRLKPIFNTLDDLQKITGGSAETFWLTANRGMHIDIDKEMELNPEDEEALSEEIDEYQHNLRRILRTRGVKVNPLGAEVAMPKDSFSVQLALISANTGIPQRVLMGAEAGQLASQQDRANWAVVVDQRIANFAEPVILKPFVELLDSMNVLKKPENLYIDWPETFKMSPLERAQTSAQMARSAVNIVRSVKEAKEAGFDILSVEEMREVIAPGSRMPIFTGVPSGTLPPEPEPIEPVVPQQPGQPQPQPQPAAVPPKPKT